MILKQEGGERIVIVRAAGDHLIGVNATPFDGGHIRRRGQILDDGV